ncbi:ERF family protein [Bacillus cereus group sp. N21]|uniref:ERF family protein n=1 Tax=Bacillus cereus group sp. N21 TaxID=2794591 RepID=UPI0018F478D9|nr:ERF family protein [Bacillus cereus group sp. N21]MBJ8031122.1 ERF family protein [Bacillus cereus group sp. N21]
MKRSETIGELAKALVKFQAEVENPKNTASNPMFKSKYAPLDVVINTVKPILTKYGLSFMQSTGSEGESIIISTMLLHESGEWIESEPLTLPAYQIKGGGVKDFTAQGAGSGITYGRRYSLTALLGISSEDDDDGNGVSHGKDSKNKNNNTNSQSKPQSSGSNGKASEKQMKMIQAKIAHVAVISKAEKQTIEDTLKSKIGTDSLTDISPQIASKAIETLIGWEDQYKKAN